MTETETPNSRIKESISALVDGENDDLDLQRILKSMDGGDKVRETWTRYHIASAIMNKEQDVSVAVDLSASLRDVIAKEAPVRDRMSLTYWWNGLAKTAVAATVTLGVVFAAQQFTSIPPENQQIVAETMDGAESTGSVVPQGFELPPLTTTRRVSSADSFSANARSSVKNHSQGAIVISSDKFQQHVNRLMLKHAEQVSSTGAMGVIPLARVSELSEGDKE